jgi:hypothetical protein
VYSLVTGELHQVRRFGHREEKKEIEGTEDALVVRNKEEGLVKRQGLESVAGKSCRRALYPHTDPYRQPTTSPNDNGQAWTSPKASEAANGNQVPLKRDGEGSRRGTGSMG